MEALNADGHGSSDAHRFGPTSLQTAKISRWNQWTVPNSSKVLRSAWRVMVIADASVKAGGVGLPPRKFASARLKQPKIREVPPQRRRQLPQRSPRGGQVARGILRLQIPPTLKRPARLPVGGNRLR